MSKPKTAAEYASMTKGTEAPADAMPVSIDALRARRLAIHQGRLTVVARDEAKPEPAKKAKPAAAKPAKA